MRKREKEIAVKLLDKLHTMHDEAQNALESDKETGPGKAVSLFTNCQSAAIKVGNLVEKSEGEGSLCVRLLEEYCEELFLVSEKIAGGGLKNPGDDIKPINQKLDEIIENLEKIQIRKEVVFLPYKASMWDSLESVWKKANEDPTVDAIVIPIPYYDKNPDESVKETHYEGDQYPDYVPIVDYREYDFETRRPDEVYIHNPYDENNYVTSVYPFYYSKNLKKFTDKLVYIPYYVLDEPDPENPECIEKMMPYVCQSGVFYADEVIVQSEAMKKTYVKCLCKKYGEGLRATFEKKVKGTGSPKFEKLLNAKREDQKIPEEWLKVLKKPDGSFKKVIMYNTGVSAFVNHEEKMLKKMWDSLKVFEENQDIVALIWRPHPLLEATIENARPELLPEYKKMVDEFKAAGWGIYDDSADLDRAIVLSDAYYGDPSSIVQLYQKIEKPVMIENMDVLNSEED